MLSFYTFCILVSCHKLLTGSLLLIFQVSKLIVVITTLSQQFISYQGQRDVMKEKSSVLMYSWIKHQLGLLTGNLSITFCHIEKWPYLLLANLDCVIIVRSWMPGLNGYGRLSVINSTHVHWQQVIALSDQPLDAFFIIQESHGLREVSVIKEHLCPDKPS